MNKHSKRRPWYERAVRWGQTNLTELDPTRYDGDWWRDHWRRTGVQGIIVNAAGIVFYYPSKYQEVHKAKYLGNRDLFGEIVQAAHEEGIAVLARMDANRVHERFYIEHPEWIAVDDEGNPYRAGELYVTCINSPYYHQFLPGVFREIITQYGPEGFTDNSYSGLDRNNICYCKYCTQRFREEMGMDLPKAKNWADPTFRKWVEWSYACRLDIWDLNSRVTQEAGGEDCLWVGMISGDPVNQSIRFRDLKEICQRAKIIMLDYQTRGSSRGFQANGEAGKLIHEMLGWDKLIPESMAMYQAGEPTFRVASKPEPEARLWALEGFAGTIQPWWHHVGAYHEDRRQYKTALPLLGWHQSNQQYLHNREPMATVGVVWSQRNIDFYGQDDAFNRVVLPWRGMTQSLIRSRIPYLPVHVDSIDANSDRFSVLILPNVGVLSDAQCDSIRRFVETGGALIATGQSSLYDEWGDGRPDFALADLFGVSSRGAQHGLSSGQTRGWEQGHSYLRLSPELRSELPGPQSGAEPVISGSRHVVLEGFEETDILGFGGRLEVVDAAEDAQVLMTFIPPFPIYPPETAWACHPTSSLPGLVLKEGSEIGPVAYLPADIDRCYGRYNYPDHGHLLSNIIRWAAGNRIPLEVEGKGFVDCHLYSQRGRLMLHMVNLTNSEAWRTSVHELTSVGPFRVRLQVPDNASSVSVELRVAETISDAKIDRGWLSFEIGSVIDHELAVVEWE